MIPKNIDTRTLQRFLLLANDFEGRGVTDIRFVREQIERDIHERMMAFNKDRSKHREAAGRPFDLQAPATSAPCPACGKPTAQILADGEHIIACRACRWSALVGGA